MEILLAPSPPAATRRPQPYRLVTMAHVPSERSADDLIRLASIGAIAFSIAIALVIMATYEIDLSPWYHFAVAVAATALYLPLGVRHVRFGLRGERPPHLRLTLSVMAVVIVAVTPLLGADWFFAYNALVASFLITMTPRFSFPATACILIGVWLWAGVLGNGFLFGPTYGAGQALYLPLAVAVRAAVVFVLVWLVGALRRVQSARVALAQAALEAERGRIDIELSDSVGADLEEVVLMGSQAQAAVIQGSPKVKKELESLVTISRRALANARRMIRAYELVSPATELDRAASLLRAAGIGATIEVPDMELPPTLEESLRLALRVEVAQLLSEDAAGPVVLKLSYASSQFQLRIVKLAKSKPAA